MLADYPQTNEVFSGEENSDEKLARYIVLAFDDWNSMPPLLRLRLSPIDVVASEKYMMLRSLMLDKSMVRILRSTIAKLARNDVPYQAGNVTMQRNAVWRGLMEIANQMDADYERRAQAAKVGINVSRGYGDGGYRASLTEYYDGIEADAIMVVI